MTITGGDGAYLFHATDSSSVAGPWEYARKFQENRVITLSANRFELKDLSSKSFGESYDKMESISEGVVAVGVTGPGFLADYEWGFMDLSGKVVIKPQYYKVGPFKNGLARVALVQE